MTSRSIYGGVTPTTAASKHRTVASRRVVMLRSGVSKESRCSGFSFPLLFFSLLFLLYLLPATEGHGQSASGSTPDPTPDSAIAQTVRSSRGYMIRIPAVARLDSARSGWNPTKRFERRVYVIPGTGEIVLHVEIGKDSIPTAALREGSYNYIDTDSLSSNGTIYSRTFYLAHRRLRITFTPWALAMKRWTDHRETIYNTFRWDERADSEIEDLSPTTPPPIQPEAKRGLGG